MSDATERAIERGLASGALPTSIAGVQLYLARWQAGKVQTEGRNTIARPLPNVDMRAIKFDLLAAYRFRQISYSDMVTFRISHLPCWNTPESGNYVQCEDENCDEECMVFCFCCDEPLDALDTIVVHGIRHYHFECITFPFLEPGHRVVFRNNTIGAWLELYFFMVDCPNCGQVIYLSEQNNPVVCTNCGTSYRVRGNTLVE